MKKQMARVGLLIIGDEILLGRRADKHFAWARTFFGERGVDIGWVCYLGDDSSQLVARFEELRSRQEVCLSFGGIGATPDDITRQAVADAFGVPLVRHPEARRLIENQFGEGAYPNRILMADLPDGAALIPNAYNNIPGFFMDEIYCLPGFPEMAWPMAEWVVGTRYEVPGAGHSTFTAVIVPNVRESELVPLLTAAQRLFGDVRISSLPRFPQDGRWQIELGFRGAGQQVGEALAYVVAGLKDRGLTVLDV